MNGHEVSSLDYGVLFSVLFHGPRTKHKLKNENVSVFLSSWSEIINVWVGRVTGKGEESMVTVLKMTWR